MGFAVQAVTLPLRRRMIGSLIVVAGVVVVVFGLFRPLQSGSITGPDSGASSAFAAQFDSSDDTAAFALRHVVDHGIDGSDTTEKVADVAVRGGLVLVAAGAGLALVLLVSPMRGMVGLAAGIGLFGLATETGVLVGEHTRIADLAGGNFHVTLGASVYVIAAGFLLVVVGGGLAALRPLAGVVSAIAIALAGVLVGVLLAVVVGGDKVTSGGALRTGSAHTAVAGR